MFVGFILEVVVICICFVYIWFGEILNVVLIM